MIWVMRFDLNITCFLNEQAVGLVERQIATRRERRENETGECSASPISSHTLATTHR
jgi:hypothetical protein